jgi:hypothetical protein
MNKLILCLAAQEPERVAQLRQLLVQLAAADHDTKVEEW